MTSAHDFEATTIDGDHVSLDEYRGKVLLVTNVASKCGFTPQYEGLEQLYEEFRDQGLVVLGFPCDQFGHQEPGDEAEIAQFCSLNYGVTFPMFAKIDVNGAGAHPLYQWLKDQKGGLFGGRIKWNFTKFLVGPDGQVRSRYAPTTKPADLRADVEALLAEVDATAVAVGDAVDITAEPAVDLTDPAASMPDADDAGRTLPNR